MSVACGCPEQRQGNGVQPGNIKQRNARLDDDYMMYTYKVIPCSRVSTHNWKLCHFSHAGEVAARRRNPNCHQADLCAWISANKECPMGDKCTFAHNAFESWLHPDRFKTTLCSYAGACTRKFCFFAHSVDELRIPNNKQNTQLQLGLGKLGAVDASCSISTPNSSSSSSNNSSSSTILAQLRPNWTTTNPAVLNGAGGLYLPTLQGSTRIYGSSSNTVGTVNPLPALVVAGSPLSAAAAGPATLAVTVPNMTAAAAGLVHTYPGVTPYWDGATMQRLGSTPIGSDSSCQSSHILFDTVSTPSALSVATVSPNQSPVTHRPVAASSSSSVRSPIGTLPCLDSSQQQDSNLRQQLLQHLATLQQQQQQAVLNPSSQGWGLGTGASITPPLLSLSPVRPQAVNLSTISTTSAAATWPASLSLVSMQATQQQQQWQQPGMSLGVQVTPGLSVSQGIAGQQQVGFNTTSVAGLGFNLSAAPDRFSTGSTSRYLAAADTAQLQQQFGMLSFAMPQPV